MQTYGEIVAIAQGEDDEDHCNGHGCVKPVNALPARDLCLDRAPVEAIDIVAREHVEHGPHCRDKQQRKQDELHVDVRDHNALLVHG